MQTYSNQTCECAGDCGSTSHQPDQTCNSNRNVEMICHDTNAECDHGDENKADRNNPTLQLALCQGCRDESETPCDEPCSYECPKFDALNPSNENPHAGCAEVYGRTGCGYNCPEAV